MFLSAHSVHAECMSVDITTKCAKIPSYFSPGSFIPGTYTSNSWNIIYYDMTSEREVCYWSGDYAEWQSSTSIRCDVTYPFKMTLLIDTDFYGSRDNAYEVCAKHLKSMVFSQMLNIGKLPGDQCPDGFYTVPYDIPCGEGFVDTANIPSCADDTSGDFCTIIDKLPCVSGVTKLSTSTGLSFQLWAEKYTTPSLNILYNGVICYVNLELGSATNAVNINNNGKIYHTTN